MRLLADLHIAPRTVHFLRSLGHDVLRVTDLLPATASDETIVERAAQAQRVILTQDLDMTAIIALSRRQYPSLVTLRLRSVRIEFVNTALQRPPRSGTRSIAGRSRHHRGLSRPSPSTSLDYSVCTIHEDSLRTRADATQLLKGIKP